MDRRADRRGSIGQHATSTPAGSVAFKLDNMGLDGVHHGDDIGAGLPTNVENDGGRRIEPRGDIFVFRALDDRRDVRKAHRRAVAKCDDDLPVILDALQLIIGVDRVGARLSLETSFRRVDIGAADRRAQVVDVDAVSRRGVGIDLDPDRWPLSAADLDESDAGRLAKSSARDACRRVPGRAREAKFSR